MESYGIGNESSNVNVDISTLEKCLETIKCLDNNMTNKKREVVFCIFQIGYIIKHIKSSAPKGCGIGFYLNSHGIKYSDSYCRNLILIHDLIEKHKNLLKCCLNVRTFVQRRKMIEEICNELNW